MVCIRFWRVANLFSRLWVSVSMTLRSGKYQCFNDFEKWQVPPFYGQQFAGTSPQQDTNGTENPESLDGVPEGGNSQLVAYSMADLEFNARSSEQD
jgi:hypothetical protein